MRFDGTIGRRRGFTLIEVLLAVAVFAIVLAAINSVFFSALRLRNKTTELFERALPLQQSLSILQKDLEGIMLPSGPLSGKFSTTIEGMSNIMTFVGERVTPDIYTSSGNVNELGRWSDVQKVGYFLALPTNTVAATGGKELVRQVTRNLLAVNGEEPEAQWLMSGVQTIHLEYYDGLAWTDTWDSTASSNLPSAIKVEITLAEDYEGTTKTAYPIELVVPVMTRSSTTSTNESGGNE